MKILSISKTLMALAFSSLVISPLQAKSSDTNIKEVRNEVGIMLNILQASLKQRNSEKNIRFRAESVFYLAEQGVVFEINSGRHGGNFFGFDVEGLIRNIPAAPFASSTSNRRSNSTNGNRVEMSIGDREIDVINFSNEEEIEAIVESFLKHGDHYDDDLSDKMRDLSEEKRELGWEKREYDRSRRDLEFEKRNADSERRKEIDKRLNELNREVAKLESKAKELEAFRSNLKAQRNQEVAKRQAVKQKLYEESLSLFEDTIGDMLCRYGAGLRTLPDDENVTFLLSDFVNADNDSVIGSHDKVYVFKHRDIQACVTGKSNKGKLLAAAKSYLF